MITVTMERLPNESKYIISKYFISCNKYYTLKEIEHRKKDLGLIFLTLKVNKLEYNNYIDIHNFVKTYHIYQYDYDNYINKKIKKNQSIKEYSPILIDILNTNNNLPCTYSSQNKFDEQQLFIDIQKIIKLIPNSIHSTFGQMRCRTDVTPLYAAISNSNVPLYIIEYLLKNGAKKNLDVCIDGKKYNILDDYYFCNHVDIQSARTNNSKRIRYNYIKQVLCEVL